MPLPNAPDARRGRPLDRKTPPTGPTAASVTPTADIGSDRSPLRQALDAAIAEAKANGDGKLSMKDLTVMSDQADPFRLDTPANHKLAQWLADTVATQGLVPSPLVDSSWSFVEQCKALIDSKAYRIGGAS
jgi:outer membrane receptor for monomeric catechols